MYDTSDMLQTVALEHTGWRLRGHRLSQLHSRLHTWHRPAVPRAGVYYKSTAHGAAGLCPGRAGI